MDGHRRGARILSGWRVRPPPPRWLRKLRGSVALAGVEIPRWDETKHFKLIGTTGTGKSTAIAGLLDDALERGDRAIVADPDGGYLRRFHERSRHDVVLNPFDPRSVRWDPFAEIQCSYDAEQLASGLIPSTEDAATHEWHGYARTFLAALLRRCHESGRRDVGELWRLISEAPNRELRRLLAGTAAQPFLDPENLRMFGSIRSISASAAAALSYIRAQRTTPFGVRAWVRKGSGSLFIPYHAGQIAALRSIIATWIRTAIFEAMSQAEQDLRLWFVVDELDALGAVDGLKDALARLRKFGGRCVLGFQSIAQVSSTYGCGHAQTIVENCGNTLILRCSGSQQGGTAHFASHLIGEREVLRRQMARGRDRDGPILGRSTRRSTNVSELCVTEAAILAAELEQLPDLTGYLKMASSPSWRLVRLGRRA